MTAGTTKKYADIEGNTFSRIILDEELTRDEKVAAITRELSYSGDLALDQRHLWELKRFTEYLQFKYENLEESLKTIDFDLLLKAQKFIDDTASLGKAVLGRMGADYAEKEYKQRMADLTACGKNLLDADRGMQYVYAILHDACRDAFRINLDARPSFLANTDAIDGYILVVDDCRKGIADGYAKVVDQSSRILTARHAPALGNLKTSFKYSADAPVTQTPKTLELPKELRSAIANLKKNVQHQPAAGLKP